MIDIGVIGYKNHAKKIINLLEKEYNVKYIYHPKKKLEFKNFTNKINKFLNLDCVFIICPSRFHYKYLSYFNKNKFKGYIFCEKPPVTTLKDLKKISRFWNGKIYFNFNLRHSYLANSFNHNKNLGKLISFHIFDSKPLIYKKELIKNWRMNIKDTLVTNNLIHYIDLITHKYKQNIKNVQLTSNKINKKFKIIDNLSTIFKINNILFNINISYSTGLEKLYLLYFTNGKIEITDKYIKIFFPSNHTNSKNNFEKPKLKKVIKVKNLFNNSNVKSLKYFMNFVKKKLLIKKNDFNSSIKSNNEILRISEKL